MEERVQLTLSGLLSSCFLYKDGYIINEETGRKITPGIRSRKWESEPHNPRLVFHFTYKKKEYFFNARKLIATHFIDNPNGKHRTRPLNGIESDIRVENIEWY